MKLKVGDKVRYERDYGYGTYRGSGTVSYIYPDGDIIIKDYVGGGSSKAMTNCPDYNVKAGDTYRITPSRYCTLISNSRIPKKYI